MLAMPRATTIREMSVASAVASSFESVAFGCSATRTLGARAIARPSRMRARRPGARTPACRFRSLARPTSAASIRDAGAHIGRHALHGDGKRQREILFDGELLDEHGPISEQTELIERRQPRIRIADGRRRLAERKDFPAVGKNGARDQVEEDLAPSSDRSRAARASGPPARRVRRSSAAGGRGSPSKPRAGGRARHPAACRCRAALRRCHSTAGSIEAPGSMPCAGSPWKSEPPVISSPSSDAMRSIALNGAGVVVGVVDLERVEARERKRLDSRVDASAPGMRQRRDTSRAVDDADHDFGWRTGTADERWTAVFEKTVERFLRVRHMTGTLQRTRDLGPADGAPLIARGFLEQRVEVDGHAELCEPRGDRAHALDACLALRAEELDQPRLCRIRGSNRGRGRHGRPRRL